MNTILLTGLPKREGGREREGRGGGREKERGKEDRERETHTVLMATRLVMKHIVPKPHTMNMELFQKDF